MQIQINRLFAFYHGLPFHLCYKRFIAYNVPEIRTVGVFMYRFPCSHIPKKRLNVTKCVQKLHSPPD